MTEKFEDTIAAISTAMAPSGIGIVRISGAEAPKIADRVYRSNKGKRLADQKGYTVHHGYIEDHGERIDEVLVMVLRAPHSYTGENTIEIDCHGGVLATRKVLEAVLHAGARPAEPGEFSKRAFLNGRMDLSQAEAVMDIISAKNDYALKSAQQQLAGSVSGEVREIRGKLLYETARIEAALDDPEHMSLDGYGEILRKAVLQQREKIQHLLMTADSGRLMQEGIKTVILGKPNAGKSSLLNLLLGEDRAIVTDIAGTTRDVLEEQINIRGITLRILDTAGIRNAEDQIEKIGINRAIDQAKDADLILYVADSSVPLDENDHEIMTLMKGKKAIILLNKSDLETVVTEDLIRREMKNAGLQENDETVILGISAKNKQGLDQLEKQIEKMFFNGKIVFNDQIYITNARHKKALEDACESLGYVIKSIDEQMPEDFWSIDLMGAIDALGRITGETLGEDLVNEIFAKFCMGK
ncbi:MAG: tRNA uridine-5-carboxymethylaminomethyl(34) synthesis GTPase MnmE [Eubacterium sp.]|nr:tRNA uridine-5-carboxymethylaminomethyl(34) synthesis GTPase MnmE [Eubacterium sp.]